MRFWAAAERTITVGGEMLRTISGMVALIFIPFLSGLLRLNPTLQGTNTFKKNILREFVE